MRDNRQIAMVVIAVGIVIGLVAILADTLGLGSNDDAFGALQVVGLVVGIVLVLAGVAFMNYGDRWMKPRA